MPASCQLTSSHLARSSTSTGIVAGPAPKLKMREAALTSVPRGTALVRRALGGVAFLAFGAALRAATFLAGALRRFALVVAAVAGFAIFVIAVADALQSAELLALAQVAA